MGAEPGEWSVDRLVYLRGEAGGSFVVMPRYSSREATLQELKTHLFGSKNAHICLRSLPSRRWIQGHAGAASIAPGLFHVKEHIPT